MLTLVSITIIVIVNLAHLGYLLYVNFIRKDEDAEYWSRLILNPMVFELINGTTVYGLIERETARHYHLVSWRMFWTDDQGNQQQERGSGVLSLPLGKILHGHTPRDEIETYDNDR